MKALGRDLWRLFAATIGIFRANPLRMLAATWYHVVGERERAAEQIRKIEQERETEGEA